MFVILWELYGIVIWMHLDNMICYVIYIHTRWCPRSWTQTGERNSNFTGRFKVGISNYTMGDTNQIMTKGCNAPPCSLLPSLRILHGFAGKKSKNVPKNPLVYHLELNLFIQDLNWFYNDLHGFVGNFRRGVFPFHPVVYHPFPHQMAFVVHHILSDTAIWGFPES